MSTKRHLSLGAPSLSLKRKASTADKPAESVQAPAAVNAFTEQQFMHAWETFMTRHHDEQLAVNTMRACPPKRLDDITYEMTVFSESQMQIMNAVMSQLQSEMRSALNNDKLLVAVRLETGASSPATWSEREVLAHIIDQNPAMQTYIDSLGLSLL